MGCYFPIPARRSDDGGPWTLQPQLGTQDARIPCGKCLGCREDRRTDWVTRCMHESRSSHHNTFVTLTYAEEHCPRELIKHDLQKFFKRLRKAASTTAQLSNNGSPTIRYVASGEYGEQTLRPHYHAILFNCAFPDQRRYSKAMFTSATLDRIWGKGTAKLAPFSRERAGYVAGYITKTGKQTHCDEYGEVRADPFFMASLRPAIGRTWIDQHPEDAQHGYIIINGQRSRLPRYYAKRLLAERHRAATTFRDHKTGDPIPQTDNNDPERLTAAAIIHAQAHSRKRRNQL